MLLRNKLTVCTALALACATTLPTFAQESIPPPNIIWIMADDLGYGDVGAFGGTKILTPRLDRMATEGMRFTQFYSGSTVCAPARSVLMTGLHTGHTFVRGNARIPLRPEDVTVAERLHDAGYTTGLVGKWGLGEPDTSGVPNRQGFDFFYGFLNQRNAHFYYPPFVWRNEIREELPGNDIDAQTGVFIHDRFTHEALSFVDRNANNPFFLYLAYTIPHAEVTAPEDSIAAYRGVLEEGEPHPDGKHYGPQLEPHAAFAGMVSRLDGDVGRLLDLLRAKGIADNTLVIFTSDNGPHEEGGADPEFFDSNGPFRGIKRDLYEGGIRVPTIAWWPGKVEAGTSTNHIAGFQDFLPTCLDVTKQNIKTNIDGISFLPTLQGNPGQKKHEYLYWEFYERGGKQAVRWGDWKGIRLGVTKDRNAPIELYNLAQDTNESKNVATEYPKIVESIRSMMTEAHTPSNEFTFGR